MNLEIRVDRHGYKSFEQAFKLYKKERRKFYNNLYIKHITDNKKFWKRLKPLCICGSSKINLVVDKASLLDDKKIAETF